MKLFRSAIISLTVILCLIFFPLIKANAVDMQVYKGELSIHIPGQASNTLQLQYRTKTREVLRIAIRNLVMTNVSANEAVRLDDRTASLENRVTDGYWNAVITYNDLKLDDDNYQVEGSLMLYLAGSQQTRNFSVYLKPEPVGKPYGSGIDWGLE